MNGLASLWVDTAPAERAGAAERATLAGILLLGTALRLLGLGAVGLHGDEKTMALPTLGILAHGLPYLPSGFLYPRALGQLYLMAGSVRLFGQSEWALRLPSVVCGILLIYLAWVAGRRFLSPAWNLAFAATVALLPDFIDEAQTARMYVFLATSVTAFLVLLFRWERSGRAADLVGAVVALLLGLQFHTLAIFAAPLVFFPAALGGDGRRWLQAAAAFVVMGAGFVLINHWIGAQYPPTAGALETLVPEGPRAAAAIPRPGALWWLGAALLGAAVGGYAVAWRRAAAAAGAAVLLAGGVLAELTLNLHAGLLVIAAGLVLGCRAAELRTRGILLLCALAVMIPAAELILLRLTTDVPLRQLAGAVIGWPSVWPFAALSQYSLIATLIVAAALVEGLWRLALRRPVPDHVCLAALGCWAPLLLIGLMRWDVPQRYTEAQLMPLLLAAFAAVRWFTDRWVTRTRRQAQPARARGAPWRWAVPAMAVVACVLMVDPARLAATVDAGYARHPDHKGAAQFVRSLRPGPRDIVVAEDALEQTYYLGHVDYWLVSRQVAAVFSRPVQGQLVEIYTNTPVIATGAELRALLERADRGTVYVIGSGEGQEDGRHFLRGSGIYEALESPEFHVIYRGRDGRTEVFEAPPPAQAARAASEVGDVRHR